MPSSRVEAEAVVIGAGAAGLAAARCLIDARRDVVVLEAQNRIGGRAHTIASGACHALDLGCGWLHSADRNPWSEIAAALGFHIDRTPPPWQRDDHDIGMPRAERRAFAAAANRFWSAVYEAGEAAADRPAAELLEPGGRWNELINASSTYINGAELDRVSVVDCARYADSGVNWRIVEGYGALIARYGAGLPVRLGCPVRAVDHRGRLIDIATPHGTLRAQKIIIAVPTNVIASGVIRFRPDLPAKREAAAHLPLGNAEKLFLALADPERFPAEARFLGTSNRAGTGNYHLRPFGRPVIEAYFGGRLARELALAGMESMAAFAKEEIARVLGGAAAARMTPVAASRWAADPYALGSYSHALPGFAEARATLAEPIDGRLFFAGEACSVHDFSTAHGAYRTGITAAQAVLAA